LHSERSFQTWHRRIYPGDPHDQLHAGADQRSTTSPAAWDRTI